MPFFLCGRCDESFGFRSRTGRSVCDRLLPVFSLIIEEESCLTTDACSRYSSRLRTHTSFASRTDGRLLFDLIIGMDDRNIEDLKDRAPSPEEWKKIHRMIRNSVLVLRMPTTFPIQYYGGAEGFEYVLDLLEDA